MTRDDQKENPESVDADVGVEGIEALPGKVSRYAKAKKGALDVVEYIGTQPELQASMQKVFDRVQRCGDYLVFRHYFTVDKVRLHGAQLCRTHLLCPLCAIRRGAKSLKAYSDRYLSIKLSKPSLKPFLITLTVKDGEDLEERFKHLQDSQRELWKRRQRIYGSSLDCVEGAVWSYEIKRGKNSGLWHPHLHMVALAEMSPSQVLLSNEWHGITGDSFVVDVRPITEDDHIGGFLEVFKYAVKFSDQPPKDTVHAWQTLGGKRLLGSAGAFRGVVVPDSLLDDPEGFADLPFVTLFYRYMRAAAGYTMTPTLYARKGM